MPPLDLLAVAVLAGHGIALRPETDADRPFLRDLYASQRAAELAAVPWDAATKAAFVDHQFAAQCAHLLANRPDADYLIVTRGVAPIGRLYLDRTVDPWRVAELALTPDETGKGIGTALVEWTIAQARGAGAAGVDLHVTIDNPRGAAFYRRLGFADVAGDFESHHRMLHTLARLS